MGQRLPAFAAAASLALSALAADPQPPPVPPLAGPDLAPEVSLPTRTLVAFDFAGRLRRPEVPPEVAAADLLDLDPHTRAAIDRLLTRRALILDTFVREHSNLLMQFQTAQATGNPLELLGLAQQTYVALADLHTRGTLQGSIRAALPPTRAARSDELLDEYWRAVVLEARRACGDDHAGIARGIEAVITQRATSLGREIELALERQTRSGDLLLHILTDGIALSPRQAGRIRQAVADIAERSDLEADSRAQLLLGLSILAHLDPEQAAIFIENVKKL